MNAWLILGLSIAAELFGTTCLKFASNPNGAWWNLGVLAGYVLAFGGLQEAVKTLPLGVSYAIWAGLGVVGAALIGRVLFGEAITLARFGGLSLVVAGVVVLGLSGHGH
jgi:small multidrug resistance pump